MKKDQSFDVQEALATLAKMRASIAELKTTPRRESEGRIANVHDAEDFDAAALAEGLESLADDIRAEVDRRYALLLQQSLEVYYAAEELSRDPAHADLIPHVEEMRRAYEKSYGKPIPPRPRE